jgi:hypothetical protein
MRQFRTDHPAAEAESGEVRLITEALGELQRATDERLGVIERFADQRSRV